MCLGGGEGRGRVVLGMVCCGLGITCTEWGILGIHKMIGYIH